MVGFLKRIVMAFVPLVVLLVLAETALWAAGLGQPDRRVSLTRGFDRDASYLVADTDVDGGWRTRMWELDHLEVKVPPRSDRHRLILFGGSNTQGFPHRVLSDLLNARDPEPGWEVINLGRSGYGSERVSILFEQALERLDPDVVLIYSGHNEFMERGFERRLQAAGAMSWRGRLSKLLMHLRLMNVLADVFQPELKDRSGDRKPEPRGAGRAKAFQRIQYDDTLLYWKAYEENLRSMVQAARNRDVGVVLSTLMGLDFEPPYVTNQSRELSKQKLDTYQRLAREGRKRIPQRFRNFLIPPVRLKQPDWGMVLRTEEREARRNSPPAGGSRIPAQQRQLSGVLAVMPRTEGRAASIEGAHWADPLLWTTPVYDVLETISQIHSRELTVAERDSLEVGRSYYEQALKIAPDYPWGYFELGLIVYLLGDDAAASEAFEKAFIYDRAPQRVNALSNDMVRAIADDTSVTLVDADRLFRERSPSGLLGYEVMTDVCHLQPGVRPILMLDFMPAILEAQARRE